MLLSNSLPFLPGASILFLIGASLLTLSLTHAFQIEAVWSTTYDEKDFVADVTSRYPVANLTFLEAADPRVNTSAANVFVTPNQRQQAFYGWGAGITDATAYMLQQVRAVNETAYWEIMRMLFDTSDEYFEKGGAMLDFTRTPLGACDFSLAEYTFADTADGTPDPELKTFTIDKAPKVWTTLQDIRKVNKDVKHFFAPWSQPAWMKINQLNGQLGLHGGNLNPQYYQVYAQYLRKSVQALDDIGIPTYRLSLQNEPNYGVSSPLRDNGADLHIQSRLLTHEDPTSSRPTTRARG